MNNKVTYSNILIVVSFIFTILVTFYPSLYVLGINNIFLEQWLYHIFIIQFFTGVFIHWWLLHLLANSIFLYIFWNIVEVIIWKRKLLLFFTFIVFFIGSLLSYFNDWWNTIWISWFCMALISYYTLELKSKNNPEYKWGITAIILNIIIWFVPGVSLLWHLFWAIWWIIFYYLNISYYKKNMVWIIAE